MDQVIDIVYSAFTQKPVVCTDTRKITEGCIFIALRGEHFNGNMFADQAISAGAALAVVDDPSFKTGKNSLLVPDTLAFLQQLANHHRRQLNIPFIAITGSNGKTTTKELVSAVLSTTFKTCFTAGNLNNHIGVPLTLLSVTSEHQVAVIEMGANHLHEIEMLCRIAEPTHGLITNIGKAHLEGFGGLEGVKRGKGELFAFLRQNKGIIFINSDQPYLMELLGDYNRFVSYGSSESADISGMPDGDNAFLRIAWKRKKEKDLRFMQTRLTGNYNLPNVLASVCIGDYFSVSPAEINRAIESYEPGNQRSQVLKRGSNTIVLDAYNANPTSMEAAIENFSHHYPGSKMVVLGDMLELGNDSAAEHANIISVLKKHNFEQVVLVGKNFGAAAGGFSCFCFDNSDQAKEWLGARRISGMSVLIKGSRGLKMEKALEAL